MPRCEHCGTEFPADVSFVQPMFICTENGSGYVDTCAKCADKIQGGLRGEIACDLLEEQLMWEAQRKTWAKKTGGRRTLHGEGGRGRKTFYD